ncbi:MAG TPA: Hpt domain-containing protein [Burkholderiaceae bacterium]|nr:Hpt domain-containing protein [Burkholderiaceae bacterium]
MITPLSFSPQGAPDSFDAGPLSWVMGEIREALACSKTSLHESITLNAEMRSTAMRHAKAHLHQAHGALQMVDIDGVTIITEAVEDLFDRIGSGQLELTADIVQGIDNAYHALIEYLEELLSGVPHQPIRLFPYYRTLMEARGAERIHPADLFFPNLAIRPQLLPSQPKNGTVEYAGLRKRFERALLAYLKNTEESTRNVHASAMRDIIAEIEQAQSNPHSRAFWWVMHGFAEAVTSGQVANEIYIKQLFARINLQLRRLSEGSTSIAERVLHDALFFIAGVENPSSRVSQIKAAYQMDGAIPTDYQKRRYGQIDVDALVIAKERLAQAKNIWNRIAAGDLSAAQSFEQEMTSLADVCARLNSPSLSKLLRELNGIARHAAHADPGDSICLEMATSLLFIENALNDISRLPEDFPARADAITARLLSIVSGEQPAESAQWLDDMSRQARHRQTMMTLAAEMQSNLRQIEKILDEYFNDPSQRAGINQIGPILHQIEGALAVLDQDDAMRAVQHTQAAIMRFAEVDALPERSEFEQVARNIGALSFFIEALQLDSAGAKRYFLFDPEQGIFHARLIEKNADVSQSSDRGEDLGIELIAGSDVGNAGFETVASTAQDASTVEKELAYHQQQSAELATSLSAEPENAMLQMQLEESLEQVRRDATLVDNPEVNDRAQAAIAMLRHPDFNASQNTVAEIMLPAAAPVQASGQALMPSPAPVSDEAIDAELLEIFLSEAEEVLTCVTETTCQSRSEPYNQDHLTTLRRSFHTLKGSSRMVGLSTFGEAAWSIEQVLNLRLSEARAGDSEFYMLLDTAAAELGEWVQELNQHGRSDRTAAALISAAERVKSGGLPSQEEPKPAALLGSGVAEIKEAPQPVDMQDQAPSVVVDADVAGQDVAAEMDADILETSPAFSEPEEIVLSDAALSSLRNGDISASVMEEQDAELPVGDMSTAGPQVMPVAEVIDFPVAIPSQDRHDDNVKQIGDLQISVPLHTIYLAETDELTRLLSHDIAEWRHEPGRRVNIHAVHAAHSLAGSSATVGFWHLQEIAHALEMILQYLARKPVKLQPDDFSTMEHAIDRIKFMLQLFALGEMPDREPHQVAILENLLRQIDTQLDLPQAAPEDILHEVGASAATGIEMPVLHEPLPEAVSESALEPGPDPALELGSPDILPQPTATAVFAEPANKAGSAITQAIGHNDELDADLLPVFLEEARDMLPQIGQSLRAWQQKPDDKDAPQSLLRQLHTIKGSARMAGAMALGQHMHEMETRIEQITRLGIPSTQAFDDLLARHDHGLYMFEQLQNPQAPSRIPDASTESQSDSQGSDAGGNMAPSEMVVLPLLMPMQHGENVVSRIAPQQAPSTPVSPAPLVRVRADILDRLVNQAGEVSISRSKLETEVGTLRQSLSELNENVARLRDQLREIEMQAESQITSRMAQSADREFDPLEFDRFTRLQELTRMMAESVNDVGSVQQNLTRTIDNASTDLTVQARLTRDLQQDLMRVRMVQFASISERLYRVTRQAAKEVNKRVNLDIRGSAVEIDRGVLEKMVGPFEHLLRNAIVHGIESREERQAAGKHEIGELRVEIRQEGNEVAIQFADDGQGLNLDNIRNKAKAIGLLTDDTQMSDSEVTDLIFHSGFSTANEVTELAGRGIGMDVVRSEAAVLGGRVSTFTEPGKGVRFTIHLPLTLAVTQVVLLSVGNKTFAVPSVLVEQVQQLKANALASAYNDGAVLWQGQRVPLYYLPALLDDANTVPVSQQYSPIIILKSGNDRVAIHIDEIQGNREVVVKNIGPQLARMMGIAGATVLGSGDIVLILNPVPLAQRAAQGHVRAPRILAADAQDTMGAVAEMATADSADAVIEPVQGMRTQRIVMVVDDSLTVRRVTQRLLAREGYQVVLAKDGVDALEHLQSVTPDVMLVDIEMPRMDGFDLTRNLRNDERTRHIPIIMITSRTAAKHRNYALELGVNEYLGKPYQEEALLGLIAGFIGKEALITG